MLLKAVTLLDAKTGTYHPPFFVAHLGMALRVAVDLGSDRETVIGRHPADFVLCEVGEFDASSGSFLPAPVRQIGTVASFLPVNAPLFSGDK